MQRLAHTRHAFRIRGPPSPSTCRLLCAFPAATAIATLPTRRIPPALRSSYATQRATRRPLRVRRIEADEKVDQHWALVKKFREACEMRDVRHLMTMYPTLLEAGLFSPNDCRHIAQALHVRIRNATADSTRADLVPFVEQFALDIRSGALQPHPYAFVHLLSIYKECKQFIKGVELWQWLVEQDERYVSQAAYGAAIELMAYGRIMPLAQLEHLYADGLKRFPGTFAEYHLSPDAIVPDRTQPVVISGIPTLLLQGILTARVLSRDWKRAYLALDTILRLYPAQTPARFFEIFMAERPLSEAYTAYMIACRAGVTLRSTHLTALITKMRAAMSTSPSMHDRMLIVRAVANAIYAHMEAGGQLESIHVGAFIQALEGLLPERTPGEDYEGVPSELRTLIAVAAHEIVRGLIQVGMSLQINPFSALISLAGRLRLPGLLSTTLNDVSAAGLDLGPITTRNAITSAGLLGDGNLIEQLWEKVVSAAEAQGAQIPYQDWITFTKACRRAGHSDYFRSQLQKLAHTTTSRTLAHLVQQMDMPEPVLSDHETFSYLVPGDLISQLEILKGQVKNIEAVVMSGQPLDLEKTPFYMHIDPERASLGSTEHLRDVYDKMTTDVYQPPPPQSAEGSPVSPLPPAKSPTGIPLDQLRFQNWVTVLEMMDDAEAYESARQFTINAAIEAGEPLKGNPEILRIRKESVPPLRACRDVRLRVQALRAASPEEVPVFQKVITETLNENYRAMNYDQHDQKWKMRKPLRKHFTSKQPNFAQEQTVELDRPEGTPLKLTYYVGLETSHGAPHNVKPKSAQSEKFRRVVVDDKSPSAQNAPTNPFQAPDS